VPIRRARSDLSLNTTLTPFSSQRPVRGVAQLLTINGGTPNRCISYRSHLVTECLVEIYSRSAPAWSPWHHKEEGIPMKMSGRRILKTTAAVVGISALGALGTGIAFAATPTDLGEIDLISR